MVDNFREAYWIAARACAMHIGEEGLPEKTLAALYRKDYEAALLLGETSRPEGATVVMFSNALSRFRELGFIDFEAIPRRRGRAKASRERRVVRGPQAGTLDAFVEALGRGVALGRLPQPGAAGTASKAITTSTEQVALRSEGEEARG